MGEEQLNYELEKMIRRIQKVAKDKYISLQSREKRKLKIKERKFVRKSFVNEDEF